MISDECSDGKRGNQRMAYLHGCTVAETVVQFGLITQIDKLI